MADFRFFAANYGPRQCSLPPAGIFLVRIVAFPPALYRVLAGMLVFGGENTLLRQ